MKAFEEIEIKELKHACRSLDETGFLESKIHCRGKAKGADVYIEFMMAVEGLTEEQQCKLPDDVIAFYNDSVSDEVVDDSNNSTQKFEQNYIEPQQRNLFPIVQNAESNKDVTEPTKKCPRCKKYKGYSQFNKNKLNKDGMQTYCRKCQSEMNRNSSRKMKDHHYNLQDNSIDLLKRCPNCEEYKSYNQFYKKSSNKDGLQTYCIECQRKFMKKHRPKQKQPTKNLNTITKITPTTSKEDLLYIEALSILINYNATKFERRGAVEILKDIELHRNGNKPPEVTIESLQQFCKKDVVKNKVFPFGANTIGETIALIEKGGMV